MSLFFILLGSLALIGLPLFLILSAIALFGYISSDQLPVIYFAELIRLAGNHTLVAIPLFTVGGYILAESGASERLVRVARALIGWMPGGLGVVAIAVMALFTAFTGASGVTIVAMGGLLLPTLIKSGFKERFSLGLLTSSGSVGLLFPPSLPLILYGVVAEVPIDELFLAGIIPGCLIVGALSLYCIRQGISLKHTRTVKEHEPVLPALKAAGWEIPLPLVVVGGIYAGLFTVTEAAAATVAYLILVECFILGDIHPIRKLPRILAESSVLIGGILVILGSALALTNVLVFLEIPTAILNWITTVVESRIAFLILLNVFLLIVGCLMDIFSALVVIVPLILPVAVSYGISPIHLGIIFLANLEIGYSTPPVGLNLFIASFRFNRPVLTLYRATLPFLAIQIIVLLIVTYAPILVLLPVKIFTGGM